MITLDDVRQAVNLLGFDSAPAMLRMAPEPRGIRPQDGDVRQAGVLMLLYPEQEGWQIVLTRRTDQLRGHSGQISFPGGSRDPQDESFTATALRETCEELGLCAGVEVIGTLTPLYIPPSNFEVFPTVASVAIRPAFTPNSAEVAEVLALPLHALLDERTKGAEQRVMRGVNVHVPYYLVGEHKVWGATAIIMGELEGRLRAVVLQERLEQLLY